MRALLLVTLSCFSFLEIKAQTYEVDLSAEAIKSYETVKKGEIIQIDSVKKEYVYNGTIGWISPGYQLVTREGKNIDISKSIGEKLKFNYKTVQDIWDTKIITNVLHELNKKGMQNELRSEMEEDALEFIDKVKTLNVNFNDPYLESYIYSLIAKIAPVNLIDGRPGNINLLLLSNPSLNASMYPNGTLVINSGLIANLHTEDELVAILSHEIAHFVCDHSIQNINKEVSRQKRAAFWAALATGLTAVAEGYAAYNNNYYIPGGATLGMAVLSSSIASQVTERLGMKYNSDQEYEADQLAVDILGLLGYDRNALSTALNRLKSNQEAERSVSMYFSSYTHPALMERIYKAGSPQKVSDIHFERKISFAVTKTALMKYQDRRFRQALSLVSQNIENNVGTAEDYVLKANCCLSLYNTQESNQEVLHALNKAKELNPEDINIYKSEVLALLRLDRQSEALEKLKEYQTKLDVMRQQTDAVKSGQTWDYIINFINTERNWSRDMIVKLNGMVTGY